MKYRSSVAWAAILGVLLVAVAVYVWQPGGTRSLELISDVSSCAAAILSAVLSFLASARFDRGVPQRRVWYMIGSGMSLWAIAELLWAYLQIGEGHEVPYPSLADLIWAVGYAPLVLGLWLGHRSLAVRPPPRQRQLALLAYGMLLAVLVAGLIRPMVLSTPSGRSADAFIGAYYLVGDLTLAFVATLSLIVMRGGLIGRPWLPIIIGLLLFSLSDTGFAYAAWAGAYRVGHNLLSNGIDIAYFAAYLLIALGAYRQATLRLAEVEPPTSPRPS